jgi:UDP-glucose 4-epimerase
MRVWIVGAGGLLGSSVRGALAGGRHAVVSPGDTPWPWREPAALGDALRARAPAFAAEAAIRPHEGWAIVWCAGGAVVASDDAAVSEDGAAWERFLSVLSESGLAAPALRGAGLLLLASSAGGVWGGHDGPAITESTPPSPISEYGRGHLRREQALVSFTQRHPGLRTLVVRLSNLYGPAQRLDKPQGLVSHVARSLIHRRPVHIYVPLDTVRDYLYAPDAGAKVAAVLERGRTEAAANAPRMKILASEEETSVGGLLAIFRRVTRRQVAVTAGLSPVGRRQPLRLRFRSETWPEAGRRARTPLPEGVVEVYRHQLAQFTRGMLPAPPPGP